MFLKATLLLLIVVSLGVGHSARERHRPAGTSRHVHSAARSKASHDLTQLITKLRHGGARVALTKEKISQPFFAVSGRIIKINGEAVQVFHYPRPSAADADAKKVSADGSSIGTSKPSWMAPPHFFRSGKFLVLYIGGNETVLNVLQGALGSQFAGA